MHIAGISTNVSPSVVGFKGLNRANMNVVSNNIQPNNSQANYLMDSNYGSSLVKNSKVSFTANPEAAKGSVIKLTQEAGKLMGQLLIKAKEFAAERLGLLAKANLSDVEIEPADLEKAIEALAKKDKGIPHVGFDSILKREHGIEDQVVKSTKEFKKPAHVGFQSIEERRKVNSAA